MRLATNAKQNIVRMTLFEIELPLSIYCQLEQYHHHHHQYRLIGKYTNISLLKQLQQGMIQKTCHRNEVFDCQKSQQHSHPLYIQAICITFQPGYNAILSRPITIHYLKLCQWKLRLSLLLLLTE